MSADRLFWACRLGRTDYQHSFEIQEKLRQKRIYSQIPNLLILTEHAPLFTLGKRGKMDDFLVPPEQLLKDQFQIIQSNRGGEVTYHGPGQIVGYFIFDMRSIQKTIVAFVRMIEEVLIQSLAEWGIKGGRDSEHPGVWIGENKIAAIGLHFSRSVSMHGFALNVQPSLNHFSYIIPCGIRDRGVTSIERETDQKIEIRLVEEKLVFHLSQLLPSPFKWIDRKELFSLL